MKELLPMAPAASGQPCCPGAASKPASSIPIRKKLGLLGLALAAWVALYVSVKPLAEYISFTLLGLTPGTRLGEAVNFFIYDAPKIMLLLTLVVFSVGVLRSFFTIERSRAMLTGKRQLAGCALAALLGAATPFCSCSAVPLFIGFVGAGIPLGITLSFLITAPMVNELALGMLYAYFGWDVAAAYLGLGMLVAVTAGYLLGNMGLEKELKTFPGMSMASAADGKKPSWSQRMDFGFTQVREIVGSIWPFILGAVAVGSIIHGYVPQQSMETLLGKSSWWSVPLAVGVGVPLYGNCVGAIPVMEALLTKGAALGTVLAFVMSVASLSLPEAMILRRVMSTKLIFIFFGTVGLGILFTGYAFNLMF